eukprot:Selendium_serpulae@DN6152_c0_g2_i3.p1
MPSKPINQASLYRFKDIVVVPPANALVDLILSKTNRKTPTVVHPQFKIHRIRSFYMRKCKFCNQTLHDKLSGILTQFPRLEDIHPFYAELCNVLYDRDHFKLALGQVATIRGVGDRVAKHYVRLLKYADSPYKCKMLKRACLGRLATSAKRLSAALAYLEEVRQHLSRLPQINPATRTLILAGYPNVGKSSFMNSVSKANVEVEPYAFTTRSLYVGHFDYDFTRWQVIDTPGVLDRPLEKRNTIEMTAITALAHIHAAVLYFIDISEQCGYSIVDQVALFHSISPLFRGKPLVVVINKTDLRDPRTISEEEKAAIESIKERGDAEDIAVHFSPASCVTKEGVDATKNKACDLLLAQRVEKKINDGRADRVQSLLYVALPQKVSVGVNARPPCIPASVTSGAAAPVAADDSAMGDEPSKAKTERDLEDKMGGPGVYRYDMNKAFIVDDEAWRYDVAPEFYNGKNVADFVDPNVQAKVAALLEEEKRLQAELDPAFFDDDVEWSDLMVERGTVHGLIGLKREAHTFTRSRATARPGKFRGMGVDVEDMKGTLDKFGYQPDATERGRPRRRAMSILAEKEERDAARESSEMGGDPNDLSVIRRKLRARTRSVSNRDHSAARRPSRMDLSLPREEDREYAEKQRKAAYKKLGRLHKKGEADRFIPTKPKHLMTGKRGAGKTDRR